MLHIRAPESINYLLKREGGREGGQERNWLVYYTHVKYSWFSFVWYDWKRSKSDIVFSFMGSLKLHFPSSLSSLLNHLKNPYCSGFTSIPANLSVSPK